MNVEVGDQPHGLLLRACEAVDRNDYQGQAGKHIAPQCRRVRSKAQQPRRNENPDSKDQCHPVHQQPPIVSLNRSIKKQAHCPGDDLLFQPLA